MERADEIVWESDSEERLRERASEKYLIGIGTGHPNLGDDFLDAILSKIDDIEENVNSAEERKDGEKVATVTTKGPAKGYVIVYKKEYYSDSFSRQKVRVVIKDVRPSY